MIEIFKYSFAGILNTAVGYAVFWIALRVLHLSPETANAIGYVFTLGLAFLLNRFFVFTGARLSLPIGLRFVVAFIVAFALNHGVLVLLVRIYLVLPEVAQILSMIVYTISFFVLNKYFVFAVRHLD